MSNPMIERLAEKLAAYTSQPGAVTREGLAVVAVLAIAEELEQMDDDDGAAFAVTQWLRSQASTEGEDG